MHEKIEALIQEESDPRSRAHLMILYQISVVLADNVSAVRETAEELRKHRDQYESHVAREEALLNQGRGIWWLACVILPIALTVLSYLYTVHIGIEKDLRESISNVQAELRELKAWKDLEDSRKLFAPAK